MFRIICRGIPRVDSMSALSGNAGKIFEMNCENVELLL
jgi:hypothetical protein